MQVSKFQNIYSKNPVQSDLKDELLDIKNGKYKNIINKCREYTSKDDYNSYKALKNDLPTVTFCGTFGNGRKLQNLASYNKIIILDIDHIEDSDVLSSKKVMQNDKYVYAVWLSPSGEGLKALVKIDGNPSDHKLSFDSLKEYFFSTYGIELDKSGSDITRLCFASWDEDLYVNEKAEIYKEKLDISSVKKDRVKSKKLSDSTNKSAYATEGLNLSDNRKNIILIIKYLKRKNLSITYSYDEWLRVAIAIAVSFSYDLGEKYFLRLCELDGVKYDESESIKLLKYCYNNRNVDLSSGITFGTIVFYAKQKGFKTKKDRFE